MAARFEGLSDLEWRLFEDIFPPKPCGKFFSSLVPYPLRTKNLKIFRFPLDKLVCPKYLYFMSLQNLSSDSSTKI
ncbi:hypothetical protein, partial [uncultured Nostoc sp.]|uniref:hypothetical protein n=1 Tax=uncultured Nostoc sp. TaxID=340711 RepID=UPI0035C9CF2F